MIYCVSISVYDTALPPASSIPLDYAERKSCRLIYEGADDKFIDLMPSRLEFSLEVPHTTTDTDLYYINLFSGDEVRFKATLADQDSNVLWEGFLLPDEYSEPYTVGTFYVNFTAVDGLATLKGKYLPDSFYRARHSISKILADCLGLIPLDYELWAAPAISNEGGGTRLDTLFLPGSAYKSNDSKQSADEILESVVKSLGCTLYQQDGRWNLIGVSIRGNETYTAQRYDSSGAYIADTTIAPEGIGDKLFDWNTLPNVTLKPPFKEITVKTDIGEIISLLPEDIAVQSWTKTQTSHDDYANFPPSKYWIGTGLSPVLLYKSGVFPPDYTGQDMPLNYNVGAYNIYTSATDAQVLANYISLSAPVYVRGGDGQSINFRLKLSALWFTIFGIPTLDNDTYVYDVLLDGTTLFSNRGTFTDREAYYLLFEETGYNEFATPITGQIEVENFVLPNSGFLDVRVHHIQSSYESHPIGIEILEIDYVYENTDEFVRTRNLNRTNTEEIEVEIGDSSMDVVDSGVIYQPLYPDVDVNEIDFTLLYNHTSAAGRYYGTVLNFDLTNYNLTIANLAKLYIKRQNSDFYQFVKDYTAIGLVGSTRLIQINTYDGQPLEDGDQLFYHDTITNDPQTTTLRDYREEWDKVINPAFTNRLGFTLAEVFHEGYSTAAATFEGSSKGIFFPGDLVRYDFNNVFKKWVPLRIEIEFGENQTKITASEFKDTLINDYIL